MIYTAPDGFVIESKSLSSNVKETVPPDVKDIDGAVSYTCEVGGIPGVYVSYETKSANTPLGIQQIKITRVVTETTTTITVVESTDDELKDYLSSLILSNVS